MSDHPPPFNSKSKNNNNNNISISSTRPEIFQFDDIKRITQDPIFDLNLIEAIADGFCGFPNENVNLCPIHTTGAPPMAPLNVLQNSNDDESKEKKFCAQVCIKSGYITNDKYFVLKVASGVHPLENLEPIQLFSQSTERLVALLMDEGILTELRTAAVGAVAVKYLGPTKIQRIGMIGTNIQARYQLRYLKHVTDCRNLILWGRNLDRVEALKKDLLVNNNNNDDNDKWDINFAQTTGEMLDSCDIIITTTCAREALINKLNDGNNNKNKSTLIFCIGSDSVGKQELGIDLVRNADVLVRDSMLQTQERGENQHAIRNKDIKIEDIKELGDVLHLAKKNKEENNSTSTTANANNPELTILNSSGVAVQDYVVTKMVYESLLSER